jgi:hypothetical protein
LAPLRAQACGQRQETVRDSVVQIGPVTLNIGPESLGHRIVYTMPWRVPANRSRPSVRIDGQSAPLLVHLPAHRVIKASTLVSTEAVKDRVVVIGGSFLEGRDIHLTPIGAMPGTFVLANSIHSILQYGELRHPATWRRVVTILVTVIAVSAAFARFGSLGGLMLSLGGVLLLVFVAAFLGVVVHHFVADMLREHRVSRRRKKAA